MQLPPRGEGSMLWGNNVLGEGVQGDAVNGDNPLLLGEFKLLDDPGVVADAGE